MKAYGVLMLWLHTFLTSELDGVEWQTTSSDLFTPKESVPGNHWVTPDSILMILEKRRKWKKAFPFYNQWVVTIPTELCRLLSVSFVFLWRKSPTRA